MGEAIFLAICVVGLVLTLVTFALGELFEFGSGALGGAGDIDLGVGGDGRHRPRGGLRNRSFTI